MEVGSLTSSVITYSLSCRMSAFLEMLVPCQLGIPMMFTLAGPVSDWNDAPGASHRTRRSRCWSIGMEKSYGTDSGMQLDSGGMVHHASNTSDNRRGLPMFSSQPPWQCCRHAEGLCSLETSQVRWWERCCCTLRREVEIHKLQWQKEWSKGDKPISSQWARMCLPTTVCSQNCPSRCN